MNLELLILESFAAEAKRLAKRYRSFATDFEAFKAGLIENPMQGVEIAPHIRKVRMAITSKGKGKSGGARIITYNAIVSEKEGKIGLIAIYDKSEAANVKMNVIQERVRELGL